MKTVFYAKESKWIHNQTSDIVAVGLTQQEVVNECMAMYECGIAPNEKAEWIKNKFYVNGKLICTIKTKKVKDNFDYHSMIQC